MTIQQAPFFWINISLLLGIICSDYFTFISFNTTIILLVINWCLFSYLTFKKRKANKLGLITLLLFSIFLFGNWINQYQKQSFSQKNYQVIVEKVIQKKSTYIEGYLVNPQRLIDSKVSFYLPNQYLIQPSDLLVIKGRCILQQEMNQYLKSKGLFHQLKVDHYCVEQQGDQTYKSKYRKMVYHTFDSSTRGLALALFCGDKSELSDQIKEVFRVSGSLHLLALSGMHIGILVFIIHSLLFWFQWIPKQWHPIKWIFLCVFVFLIIQFVAQSASIQRASLMLYLSSFSLVFRKQINPINIISFTSFVILIKAPFLLYSLSFQLSFLAVFSIVLFPYWTHIIHLKWYKKLFVSVFLMGILSNWFTFPLILHHFEFFPIWGIFSGLLSGVLLSLMMYCGLLTLLVSEWVDLNWAFDLLHQLLVGWLSLFLQLPQLPSFKLSEDLAYGLVVCIICITYGGYQKDKAWNRIGSFTGLVILTLHFYYQ